MQFMRSRIGNAITINQVSHFGLAWKAPFWYCDAEFGKATLKIRRELGTIGVMPQARAQAHPEASSVPLVTS